MAATRLQCPGVPHVNTMNLCRSACGTKFIYDLCISAMRSGGIEPSPLHMEEATVYTILAANQTSASYRDTLEGLRIQLQQNTSLSGPERDAYGGCQQDYVPAVNSIDLIFVTCLPNCFFRGIADEYRKGMTSIENCRDRMLAPWLNRPPLYPLVEQDRNKIVLATSLDHC